MLDAPSSDRRALVQTEDTDTRLWKWGAGAAVTGAALAASALYNQARAKRVEQENPPAGAFVNVGGVALHYVERGQGDPMVLLHGNGTTTADWEASGLLGELARTHRVIAFDRPGFGYSERPRSKVWTPAAQARLIVEAVQQLGIEKPLVVGHSFGTLVALAWAIGHPASLKGLVLLGGYYFPSARADVIVASQPAVPIVGDVMRYTVSPVVARAIQPQVERKIFRPAPVPAKFSRFPVEMARRPSQIRAEAAEAAMMVPAAAAMAPHYGSLGVPVTIVAGSGDAMVDPVQAERFHETIPGSRLHLIDGVGHMVHYSATDAVAAAIREAA
jgi:pimeloyl-ACP methyl ester carboxylesterase